MFLGNTPPIASLMTGVVFWKKSVYPEICYFSRWFFIVKAPKWDVIPMPNFYGELSKPTAIVELKALLVEEPERCLRGVSMAVVRLSFEDTPQSTSRSYCFMIRPTCLRCLAIYDGNKNYILQFNSKQIKLGYKTLTRVYVCIVAQFGKRGREEGGGRDHWRCACLVL